MNDLLFFELCYPVLMCYCAMVISLVPLKLYLCSALNKVALAFSYFHCLWYISYPEYFCDDQGH
jgi:hypothetical protein